MKITLSYNKQIITINLIYLAQKDNINSSDYETLIEPVTDDANSVQHFGVKANK